MPNPETTKPVFRTGVHKLFIDRWALRYCDMLVKEGKDKALDWGVKFFHPEDIDEIAKRAREILKGKGLQ